VPERIYSAETRDGRDAPRDGKQRLRLQKRIAPEFINTETASAAAPVGACRRVLVRRVNSWFVAVGFGELGPRPECLIGVGSEPSTALDWGATVGHERLFEHGPFNIPLRLFAITCAGPATKLCRPQDQPSPSRVSR
jgi:hypothetical protein